MKGSTIDIIFKGRYVDDIFGVTGSLEVAQEKLQHIYYVCMAEAQWDIKKSITIYETWWS